MVLLCPYFKSKYRWFYFSRLEDWAHRISRIIPFVIKPKMGQINDPKGLKKYFAYRHMPTASVREVATLGNLAMEKSPSISATNLLWVHSKGDIVADFDVSKAVFSTVPARDKTFLEYKRSNHIILYDYDAPDVISGVTSFLET